MPSGITETSGPIWQKPWHPLFDKRTSSCAASERSSRITRRPEPAISLLNRWTTLMAPLAVHPVVNHYHRRKSTSAQAGDRLEGEKHVVRGLAFFACTQLLAQRIQHGQGLLHVARRSIADPDDVLSL